MNLTNKVALITGANSGIGKAIALAYGKAGANVAINYVSHPEAAKEVADTVKEMGHDVTIVEADISRNDQVVGMVNQVVEKFGRIDVLVNNAGIQVKKPFVELTPEDWDMMLSVDLRGTFLVTLYTVQEMVKKKHGRIINITSVHQCMPKPDYAPYCAAKAAVGMLTKTLAVELAPHNIKINAIAPGAIATPMNENLMDNPELLQKVINEVPLKRLGTPEDVANLALFLASDSADYVTGSTYVTDGGLLQQGPKY